MLLQVPDVLTAEQVAHARHLLDAADWVDGRVTAGLQSARVKDNQQLPEAHPVAQELGDVILDRAAAQPAVRVGGAAAARLSAALQPLRGRACRSATTSTTPSGRSRARRCGFAPTCRRRCFSAQPDEYDGGELVVEDTYGVHSVKLPAGHLVLYPSTSLHHVRPVTRGARVASFFWIQSMVRDDATRTLLFDLDTAIQRLAADVPDHPSVVQLTAVYHNLLRRWAEL